MEWLDLKKKSTEKLTLLIVPCFFFYFQPPEIGIHFCHVSNYVYELLLWYSWQIHTPPKLDTLPIPPYPWCFFLSLVFPLWWKAFLHEISNLNSLFQTRLKENISWVSISSTPHTSCSKLKITPSNP